MATNRRTFLKGAGVVGAMAATGGLTMGNAQNEPTTKGARGMVKNLTVLGCAEKFARAQIPWHP